MLLAGDIGGTKTTLAVFSSQAGPRAPLVEATFHSANYASLEALVQAFLAGTTVPIERASFGVAGPVIKDKAQVTNLPWIIDQTQMQSTLDIAAVHLLNDLEAIANVVPFLEPDDLRTIKPGQPLSGGTLAVIAPGTGLGEAFLTWDGSRYRPFPSEGGHTDFAPNDALQGDLLRYLQSRYGHVSYERVCSGLGLPNIYAYLKDSGHTPESPAVAAQLAATVDPTPVIVNAACSGDAPDPLCLATLNTFVSILGAEAGNLALKVLATGGVYLGGGIPPRILSLLEGESFTAAFKHKGRLGEVLRDFPVHVIRNPKAALLGAAYHALGQ